jgi:hypothetical protein
VTPGRQPALGDQLAALLDSPLRRRLAEHLAAGRSMKEALALLRRMMRGHIWTIEGRVWPLTADVHAMDLATQREGFHALHDWDGIADHVNPEIIPVDVLDFVAHHRAGAQATPDAIALLIDYYFFHLLSLMSLRIWDHDNPDTELGRVSVLLDALQGHAGSGQPFVADVETLILLATSHYEPDEHGYDLLLDRVRLLPIRRQQGIALGHAASLGAHLRFGFLATYAREAGAMREDNVADYPWLRWAVRVALETVAGMSGEERSAPRGRQWIEALFGGLTADCELLMGDEELRPLLRSIWPAMRPTFSALTPRADHYWPLALCFNFSHNLVKGTLIDAVLRGEPWTVCYNDLLTGADGGSSPLPSRLALARTLMEYARRSPERIRGEWLPVIVYDVDAGRAVHEATINQLASLP